METERLSERTEMEKLTIEVLQAAVYQLEQQALSTRCESAVGSDSHMTSARRCIFAAGHSGPHRNARNSWDHQGVTWT